MGSAASICSADIRNCSTDELAQCMGQLKSEDRNRLAAALEHCSSVSSYENSQLPASDEYQALTGGRLPLSIHLVEERGVLPGQLQSLVDFMDSRTHGGEIIGWRDPRNGAALKVQTINLYQVTHWVIMPMTSHARCSFVEAVATDASHQRPQWFVSHWWGEAIVDFLSCIKHHQSVRGLPDPAAYWVCAYANNQHSLGTELGTDPMQSSFLKAMALCDGVVLILDPLATPFSRVWCCFEEGMVALASRGLVEVGDHQERATLRELAARDGMEGRRPPLLLDIATVDGGQQPQLLTEGMTSKEQEMEKGHQFHFSMPSGWKAKSKREDAFPLEVIILGLQINISASNASIEVDRTRILNSLAGSADLDAPPPNDHRNIKIVDEVLQSTFALAGWRQALLKKVDISNDSSLTLAKALQGDTSRTRLDLSILKDALKEQAQVDYLASAVAPLISLVHLHLDFSNCKSLVSTSLLSESLSHLSCLQELFISFTSCGVTSGEIAKSLAKTLKKLDVSFQFCNDLDDESINDLGAGLSRLQDLEDLHLCLDCCGKVTTCDGLEGCFRSLSKLRKLKLNISRLKNLHAIDGLGSGFSGLVALEDFWMQTSFNSSIRDVCNLGKSLSYMPELRCLDLNFAGLQSVQSIEDLGQSLQRLTKLQQLRLSLKDWAALESVKGLSLALPFLTALTSFSLDVNKCMLLDAPDVAELVRASTHLKLDRWSLALFGCKQLGKDLVYFFDLEKREKLLALLEVASKGDAKVG